MNWFWTWFRFVINVKIAINQKNPLKPLKNKEKSFQTHPKKGEKNRSKDIFKKIAPGPLRLSRTDEKSRSIVNSTTNCYRMGGCWPPSVKIVLWSFSRPGFSSKEIGWWCQKTSKFVTAGTGIEIPPCMKRSVCKACKSEVRVLWHVYFRLGMQDLINPPTKIGYVSGVTSL